MFLFQVCPPCLYFSQSVSILGFCYFEPGFHFFDGFISFNFSSELFLLSISWFSCPIISYSFFISFFSIFFSRACIYLADANGYTLSWNFPIWWDNSIWKIWVILFLHLYLCLISCCFPSSSFFFFSLLSKYQSHTGLFLMITQHRMGGQSTWENHWPENSAGGWAGWQLEFRCLASQSLLSMLPPLPTNTAIQLLVLFL